MKQRFKYICILLVITTLSWTSCTKFLDKQPVNVLTETSILSDKAAFTTHMAYMYNQIPFENFSKWIWLSYYTDEMVNCRQDAGTSEEFSFNSWGSSYTLIRALNNMIEKVPSATAFTTEKEKTEALAELKFIRAYVYFTLVQRYGGVPLITEVSPLPASGDPAELYKSRDKASDVFKFIETEMESAINGMSSETSIYRFNKWSGLAYKSQAMLYAASIAKYEEVQLNGVIGIPTSEANHYFGVARDAAKLLIETGPFALYSQDADKVKNYHNLFFDKSTTNKERILVDAFVFPIKANRFDLFTAPFSHRGGEGYGGRFDPTYDMAESYEYTNNANGAIKLNNPDGTPIRYANPADLFKDKDPRFLASAIFPGSPWMGATLQIYGNVIEGGVLIGGNGADGLSQPEGTATGFYLTKWADPAPPRPIAYSSSDVDKMMMRYAEVLLNYAEAQLELGNEPEARKYINMIRERAGLPAFVNPVTMNDYRHERKIELAYEGNRYWDLKRWRIFDDVIYNTDTYALWPIYDKDNNAYIFTKAKLPSDKYTRTFTSKLYYSRLDGGIIASNPLLVENPGY